VIFTRYHLLNANLRLAGALAPLKRLPAAALAVCSHSAGVLLLTMVGSMGAMEAAPRWPYFCVVVLTSIQFPST
jgi:hypothetical protein